MPLREATLGARPTWAAEIAALINERYRATEGPMLRPGVRRTSPEEIAILANAGELHGVLDSTGAPLGVVRVDLRGERAELGMLAVSPAVAGQGVGSALVHHAEAHAKAHGVTTMDLVVVRPRDGDLPAKVRLSEWYPRLGYTRTGTVPLAELHPELVDEFAVPALLDLYVRQL